MLLRYLSCSPFVALPLVQTSCPFGWPRSRHASSSSSLHFQKTMEMLLAMIFPLRLNILDYGVSICIVDGLICSIMVSFILKQLHTNATVQCKRFLWFCLSSFVQTQGYRSDSMNLSQYRPLDILFVGKTLNILSTLPHSRHKSFPL